MDKTDQLHTNTSHFGEIYEPQDKHSLSDHSAPSDTCSNTCKGNIVYMSHSVLKVNILRECGTIKKSMTRGLKDMRQQVSTGK